MSDRSRRGKDRSLDIMSKAFVRTLLTLSVSCSLLLTFINVTVGQQVADPNFNAKVEHPAYTQKHPRVLFDEAHNNFHTAGGRYKAFADLVTNDGYQVAPNVQKFSKGTLSGYDVLVIANPLGAPVENGFAAANKPAFTDAECEAVRAWVSGGGSLLLIADHYPVGAAAGNLAKAFGVDMSNAYTDDPANYDPQLGQILFARTNKLLLDHPITRGRNQTERVTRIVTFTGQSLLGPKGSVPFLKLADTAIDEIPPERKTRVSAAGRAQGIALTLGKGRVVVLGEAAMLTAQLAGPEKAPFGGLSVSSIDNRQLALNIMHWLTKLLN
jgi:hypothetical protein